jgi:hypothetical protein
MQTPARLRFKVIEGLKRASALVFFQHWSATITLEEKEQSFFPVCQQRGRF